MRKLNKCLYLIKMAINNVFRNTSRLTSHGVMFSHCHMSVGVKNKVKGQKKKTDSEERRDKGLSAASLCRL